MLAPTSRSKATVIVATVLASVMLVLAPAARAVQVMPDGPNGPDLTRGVMGNPGVLPPGSMPYGMSYGQWGAAWWQWAIAQPLDQNPMNDQSGANAAYGQSGPVWFLSGTFCPDLGACNLATATRTITVPAGKALFFPILNAECSTLEGNGTTEAELRACVRTAMDGATGLACEVDGTAIHNVGAYRATSGLFTFGPLPDGNLFGAPIGTTSSSVSDGVWLMLAPLSAGTHTIHFTGAFGTNFALDVTYHLTVRGDRVTSSAATPALLPLPVKGRTWGQLKTMYR